LEKFAIIHAEPLQKPTDLVHSGMVFAKIFGRVKGVAAFHSGKGIPG
jgi:hypothetical protein